MKPAALFVASLLVTGTAIANDETALARSKNCMACHAIERKGVGPSYKEIAKRYAGQEGVEAKLAETIIKGGKGAWKKGLGELGAAMPPNTSVKPPEAARLVQWILGLK